MMLPEFLPFVVQSDPFFEKAVGTSAGSLSPRTNWRDLAKFEFDLPPLDEQKRIADLMWAMERHKRGVWHTDSCVRESSNTLVDSLVTNLPGESTKLSDTLNIVRGGSPRPINEYFTDEDDGLNWIKIGDVPEDGKYVDATAQKISRSGLSKTRSVKPGDFILSNSMSFGRPYIVRIDGCIHDGWLSLSDKDKVWRTDFLYHLLRSATVQKQFKQGAGGSTVKNLNIDIVRNVEVTRPSLRNQDLALDQIGALELASRSIESEKTSLHTLSASILTSIFGDS